jgi:hypothetical protein
MSRSLDLLKDRYAPGEEAPGEAFIRAFHRYVVGNRESLFDVLLTVSAAESAALSHSAEIDPLLLRAIRVTNPGLQDVHLFALSDEQLRGAVSAAKGKYFEYLVADRLNHGEQVGPLLLHEGQRAVLADSLTQPGWDLRIVNHDGTVARLLQLKASTSLGYVKEALERYPDVQILSTHEVAEGAWVIDAHMSNADLTRQVGGAVLDMSSTVPDAFWEYFNPLLPFAAIVGFEGYRLVIGKQSQEAFLTSLVRRTKRVVFVKLAGASVYALGGGVWGVPAGFAGGLLFDRTLNQYSMRQSFEEHTAKLKLLRLEQQERLLSRPI